MGKRQDIETEILRQRDWELEIIDVLFDLTDAGAIKWSDSVDESNGYRSRTAHFKGIKFELVPDNSMHAYMSRHKDEVLMTVQGKTITIQTPGRMLMLLWRLSVGEEPSPYPINSVDRENILASLVTT
jgi:hypothetical protein